MIGCLKKVTAAFRPPHPSPESSGTASKGRPWIVRASHAQVANG
jgi:hypothetical protein